MQLANPDQLVKISHLIRMIVCLIRSGYGMDAATQTVIHLRANLGQLTRATDPAFSGEYGRAREMAGVSSSGPAQPAESYTPRLGLG